MTEQDLNSLKIDKTKWKPVKFGQVVFEPKENAKDFLAEGIERVVGLEHIESENIHLTNSASAQEGTTFTKKFSIDDVLFGRRRAYLKKAAQAKFSGVCSGDIIVMRAQKDKLMPELLPFIVNNDKFFDYAITHSAGGLSPRVKFKDLANYEFLLPPKEQQADLAELLWSLDALQESKKKFKSCLDIFLRSYEKSVFFNTSKLNTKKLKDVIIKTLSGGTPDTKNKSFYESGTIPWVTTKKLGEDDYISLGESNVTEEAISRSAAKILPSGNILAGTRVGVGKFAINDVPMSYSQDITGLLIDKNITDLFFLVSQLNSAVFKSKLLPLARGSTIKGITKDDLLMLSITLPDLKTQKEISNKIKSIKLVLKGLESEVCEVIKLNKSLVNQVF